MKAIWKNQTLAESKKAIELEGNHYFPPESVHSEFLSPSSKRTQSPWIGVATYFDVVVNGERNPDSAWSYQEPKAAAQSIKGHIAFRKGITIEP